MPQIIEHSNTLIAKMDWKGALDQCLCPVYKRVAGSPSYSFGSVFFDPCNQEEMQAQVEEIRTHSEIAPFLVADMEMGAGDIIRGEVQFPSMRAAGVAGDASLAYKAGLSAAQAGRRNGGLNWTLAPCVDICACKESPMVGIRSAGERVDHVLPIVQSYIAGLQKGGCLATAKHFPGDGYSRLDQHLTTVTNPLSEADWWAGPGKIYEQVIADGIGAIMPGHIALPCLDEHDPATGLYRPATLSRGLLTGLLRERMGFEGLIVSDAIEMSGMIGYMNYFDACEAFLNAGGDVLLFAIPDDRFYEEMEKRVERGSLPLETLKSAAERVIRAKKRCGIIEDRDLEEERPQILLEEEISAAREMAREAVTVARDRYSQLPMQVQRQGRVLHVVLEQGPFPRAGHYRALTEALATLFDTVEQWDDPGCEAIAEAVHEDGFDLIVCSIACLPSYGTNAVHLEGPLARNLMGGWMRFDVPVIFISHGDPYLHEDYESIMDIVINTHGVSRYSIEAILSTAFTKTGTFT